MRKAMAEAEVGDDYFGEDPTVRRLEEETAALLGKESALFVPSGCMGNEIAVAVHTARGDAILTERTSHIVMVEAPAVTGILGRTYHLLDGDRGRLLADDVARARAGGAAPALIEVENTHNWGSGAVYPVETLEGVWRGAREASIPVHLDGARLWNASAATGVALDRYAAAADSVMVCYSKGLGAPVGSALAGARGFIAEARGVRKAFGGAMRQAGVVAAGALHALRHHRARLGEDHARAKRLAEALAEMPGLRVDPRDIETNIAIVEVTAHPERLDAFLGAVTAGGARMNAFGGPGCFRAVTHLDVDDAGLDRAIEAIRRACAQVLQA
jgi:threonine aldolase